MAERRRSRRRDGPSGTSDDTHSDDTHSPASRGDETAKPANPASAARARSAAGEGEGSVVPRRCGFVALIGAPNAGKSTFVNALVGSKVSIVSHKVQTTRALVRGILVEGEAQLILIDTPGLFEPRRRLDRAMVTTAWGVAHDADLVCLIVDAKRGVDEEVEAVVGRLGEIGQPKILMLNKVDLVDKPALLGLAARLNAGTAFEATFMVSARTGDGLEDVRRWLAARVPEGPWHYPEDQISDAPLRQMAAEITREKLYLRLHQELPYRSTVETATWKELRDGSVRIEQTIYVERDSQRKIILGKGGATIKAIGVEARREIAEVIEKPVHLMLFVKVREDWGEDPERYREMGLDFPSE
jgi:GTP-binding protein Era